MTGLEPWTSGVGSNHSTYCATTTCLTFTGRAFFRRAVTGSTKYECAKNRNCEITKESRKTCQACRLAR